MMILPLLACVADNAVNDAQFNDSVEADAKTAPVIVEGSDNAEGVLAMINDGLTTATVLDIDAALDTRAANKLAAHKNGVDGKVGTADDDLFDTIAEIDAVSYVGTSALTKLLNYAGAQGWIRTGVDYYGTLETVSFMDDQAAGTVNLVNTSSQTYLDVDVALDSRAATNLASSAPFTSIESIAGVSYVGSKALRSLRTFSDAHATTTYDAATALDALDADVPTLDFMSESDYPLVVWEVASPSTTALTAANVKSVLESAYVPRADRLTLAERTVEASSMAWAFDNYTVPQDWWDSSNEAIQPQWQALRNVFDSHLTNVTVWRFGPEVSPGLLEGDIDVFVVGVTSDGKLVGVSTISIET